MSGDELLLSLEGFEGPIDLLLTLARDQKVDLAKISILHLADQYLAFVAQAQKIRLELAADYLVMAAWLAYLKSRLLLPEPDEIKPSAEEMAEALAFQLKRLEAMREAGAALMALPQLGRDIWARGDTTGIRTIVKPVWQASIFDMMQAYGSHLSRQKDTTFRIAATDLFSIDEAIQRLSALLGDLPDWSLLTRFLPPTLSPLQRRSALASTLVACLELAKDGKLSLRQTETFGTIHIRAVPPKE